MGVSSLHSPWELWNVFKGSRNMGVSKNKGKPPKWMVYVMENPIKMDDLGVKNPYFWKHPSRPWKLIATYQLIELSSGGWKFWNHEIFIPFLLFQYLLATIKLSMNMRLQKRAVPNKSIGIWRNETVFWMMSAKIWLMVLNLVIDGS